MIHTFISRTNRKVVRENFLVVHSKQPVHQERPMSLAPFAASSRTNRRNMQSYTHEATAAPRRGVAASSIIKLLLIGIAKW